MTTSESSGEVLESSDVQDQEEKVTVDSEKPESVDEPVPPVAEDPHTLPPPVLKEVRIMTVPLTEAPKEYSLEMHTETESQASEDNEPHDFIQSLIRRTGVSEEWNEVDDEIFWPAEIPVDEYIPEFYMEGELGTMETEILPERHELILEFQELNREKHHLLLNNHHLQAKIADFLRKKMQAMGTEYKEVPLSMRGREDLEAKYSRQLDKWIDFINTLTHDEDKFAKSIADIKHTVHSQNATTDIEFEMFMKHKAEIAKTAIHSQTGHKILPQQVEAFIAKEQSKYDELKKARINNLMLQNKVKQNELAVHSNEDLSGGHQMYDFEQLKIENQASNDKVEERNEELAKFQRKISSTIHMMAHIKEKVQFLGGENEELRKLLLELDTEVAKKREDLAHIKQMKDRLREEQRQMQQRSGLLGKTKLLQDFRTKQDSARQIQKRLTQMRQMNAELKQTFQELKDDAEEWTAVQQEETGMITQQRRVKTCEPPEM